MNHQKDDEILEFCKVLKLRFFTIIRPYLFINEEERNDWDLHFSGSFENRPEMISDPKFLTNDCDHSDIWYFSDPVSNFTTLSNFIKPKGIFIFRIPFAFTDTFEKMVKYLIVTRIRSFFIDFSCFIGIRSFFEELMLKYPDILSLLSKDHVRSIIYENIQTAEETQYGMVAEHAIGVFTKNIMDITKEFVQESVFHENVTRTRLKLLSEIRPINKNGIRLFKIIEHTKKGVKKKKDYLSYIKLQIFNHRWMTTELIFFTGCNFNRIVNRTIIKFRRNSFAQVYDIFYKKILYEEEKETISNISIIFQDYPIHKIYLKIEFRDHVRRVELFHMRSYEERMPFHSDRRNRVYLFLENILAGNFQHFYDLYEIIEVYRIYWYFYNCNIGYGSYERNLGMPNIFYDMIGDDLKD